MMPSHEMSTLDKARAYQKVSREWRRHLSLEETGLVLYLVDRSFGWGRDSFIASVQNVLTGTDNYAGVGIPRRTYYRMMGRLEEIGLITRRRKKSRSEIKVNLEWNGGEAPAFQSDPQHAQEAQCATGGTSQSATSGTLNTIVGEYYSPIGVSPADAGKTRPAVRVRKRQRPQEAQTSLCPESEEGRGFFPGEKIEPNLQPVATEPAGLPADPVASVTAKLEAAKAASIEPAKAKSAKAKAFAATSAKGPTAHAVESVWRLAVMETFSGMGIAHFAWSIREKGQVSQAVKKWGFAATGTFLDFVDYSVRNWTQIVARKFGWMKERVPPTVPEVGFFLWRLNDFVEVWTTHELDRFAKDSDQSSYVRLRARGLTHDEAVLRLAKDNAVGSLRDEMTRREAAVQRRERSAKEREARASRLEHLTDTTLTAKDGTQIKVTPGTDRRPGQVWGHQPTFKRVGEVPRAALPQARDENRRRADQAARDWDAARAPAPATGPNIVPSVPEKSRDEVIADMRRAFEALPKELAFDPTKFR